MPRWLRQQLRGDSQFNSGFYAIPSRRLGAFVRVVQLYRNGFSMGTTHNGNRGGGIRGDSVGWSKSSTRSNRDFLYQVNAQALDGLGFAVTLTVGECPASSDEWHKMRRAFLKRVERRGLVRFHWLTEWQRRGVPHLHGMLYFPAGQDAVQLMADIEAAWLAVSPTSKPSGQHVKAVTDIVGWFGYLSKHAVRGLRHYQRASSSIPATWTKTGRMWGRGGDWPVDSALRFVVSNDAFYRMRRIVRSRAIAAARERAYRGFAVPGISRPLRDFREPLTRAQRRRLVFARRMLKCSKKELSAVRGVSEWADLDLSMELVVWLASQGYDVQQG